MTHADTTATVLFFLRLAEGEGLTVGQLSRALDIDHTACMWALARLAVHRQASNRGERWYASR